MVRVLFPVEGLAQADPDTDDHHLFDRPGPVDDRLPGGCVVATQHRCDTRGQPLNHVPGFRSRLGNDLPRGDANLVADEDRIEVVDPVFEPGIRQQRFQRRDGVVATGDLDSRFADDLGLDEQDLLAALQRELIECTAEILGIDVELDGLRPDGGAVGFVRARTRGQGHECDDRNTAHRCDAQCCYHLRRTPPL